MPASKPKASHMKKAVARGRIVAEKTEATKRPKAKSWEAKAPAKGLRATAASLASLMTIPWTLSVAAQATMMKKATTIVAVHPTMTSHRAYLYSSILMPFSMTADCM